MAISGFTSIDMFGGFIEEDEERTLLTNFSIKDETLYQMCVDWFNDLPHREDRLWIQHDAYARNGHPVKGCYSLHHDVRCDLSEFWRYWEKMKEVRDRGGRKPKKWALSENT